MTGHDVPAGGVSVMTGHDVPVDDLGNVRCEPCRPNNLEFCRWCGRDMMPAQTCTNGYRR
jgi:hypothetical protein